MSVSPLLHLIQHHPAEGPGEIALWAAARGVALQIYRADLGALPLASADPMILLGGPYAVHQPPPWLQREQAWLDSVLTQDAPVLAICMGAQLLATCLGAAVAPAAEKEGGWTPVQFAGGATMEVLQWHEDNFSLPSGAVLHAGSRACPHQYVTHGEKRIALQFHPEWNAQSVAELNAYFGAESPLPRLSKTNNDGLEPDTRRYRIVQDWLYQRLDNWRAHWT
ncbi:type 1 glutamine amidotransferase [Undibacterium sp. Jales W-56]|uniref:type 1 glutamine amidotransferase n=1 Tax=Undibacterium sp. Jales W-56 TaxID=2897325 RepID=UPI0021D09F00|nr:type 1 glutamine amidotransferase [Undibacterium sp. Jales W-56]MCU6434995.1 type 1 glutamine amidotransferase [Undibacterium sp. Jales W-56]